MFSLLQFLSCFSIHGLLFFNHYCFTHIPTLLSSFSIVYVLYVGFTSWDWIPYQGSWPGEDSFSLSQQLSLPESLHSQGTGWWEFNPSALVYQLVVPFFRSCLSDHIAAISWLKYIYMLLSDYRWPILVFLLAEHFYPIFLFTEHWVQGLCCTCISQRWESHRQLLPAFQPLVAFCSSFHGLRKVISLMRSEGYKFPGCKDVFL